MSNDKKYHKNNPYRYKTARYDKRTRKGYYYITHHKSPAAAKSWVKAFNKNNPFHERVELVKRLKDIKDFKKRRNTHSSPRRTSSPFNGGIFGSSGGFRW